MVDYIELSDDDGPAPTIGLPKAGPSRMRERDLNLAEVEVVHQAGAAGKGKVKQKAPVLEIDDDVVILETSSTSPSSDLPDISEMFGTRAVPAKASKTRLPASISAPIPKLKDAVPPKANLAVPPISSGIEAFSSSPVLLRSPSPVARGRTGTSKPVKRKEIQGMAPRPTAVASKAKHAGSQEDMSDLIRQATQVAKKAGATASAASTNQLALDLDLDLHDIPASFRDDVSDGEKAGTATKKRDADVAGVVAAVPSKKTKTVAAAASRSASASAPKASASTAGLSAAEKKALKEAEKATAKAQKELDKAEKARFTEANKLRTSRVDTLRQITMHISHDLDQPTSLLFHSLPILRAKFETNASQLAVLPTDETNVPGVIRFKRFVESRYDAATKVFIPLPRGEGYWQDESTLLLLVEAKEIVEHITRGRSGSAYGLSEWFAETRDSLKWRGRGRNQIVLIMHGLKAYHAKTRSLQAKAFRKNAEQVMAGQEIGEDASAPVGRLTPEDIDKELARLHVLEKCFQVHAEKKDDLEEWIWNLACDVAIRPYKLITKSHLPFSTEDVTRKGRNPKDTYQLMLEQIPLITSSSASGIVEQFPSFRSLMEGMERMERREAKGKCTRTEVETFLKDCQIRNLVTGHESNRNLGVARSTKVYNVFRGADSLAML